MQLAFKLLFCTAKFDVQNKWCTAHLILVYLHIYVQERHFLNVSNYVFTVIFTLEMMIKVISVTVIFHSISSICDLLLCAVYRF